MEKKLHDSPEGNVHEFFKALLAKRDQTIRRIENELLIAKSIGPGSKLAEEHEQQLAAQAVKYNALHEQATEQIHQHKMRANEAEARQAQVLADYNALRQQKGGFGFRSLAVCAFAGLLVGAGLVWLLARPKAPQSVVFQQFKNQNQFNLEYAIGQGDFAKVETTLKNSAENKDFSAIQPELDFFRKLIGAARRKMDGADSLLASEGFTVNPKLDETNIQKTAPKTLTITEAEAFIRTEASTKSEKLGKAIKGHKLGQWDRTLELDKIQLPNHDGVPCEVEDYWYKIETKEHLEGWVFGYFTNRSLNRAKPLVPLTPPPTAAPKDSTRTAQNL